MIIIFDDGDNTRIRNIFGQNSRSSLFLGKEGVSHGWISSPRESKFQVLSKTLIEW